MSDPEFQAVPADRRADFQRIVDYGFNAADGPQEYDDSEAVPDLVGEQFGVFTDGELRSACVHHDFTVSIRGEWRPVVGLAALATEPTSRRQGYVRTLIDGSLRRWRGEYPLAALWPFDYGYYEQFGWATGAKLAEYTCPPDALAFGRDAAGRLRTVDPDEWELLRSVTEAYSQEYDLVCRRDERWWRERIFRTVGGQDRYVYALERDGGVCGYVAYTVEADGGDRRMSVLYSAYTDREAYRGLLGFLADHDSQVEEITLYRPAEPSLLDLADEPKAIDCEIHTGMMVRVVDVVDALEAVPYPEGAAGSLTLAVEDDTAAWNDGQFELTVSDGRGECRRIEDADPDARFDIGTLSQLVAGYHSVAEARRLADLQVADEDAARRLSAWFPTRSVSPMDNF